MSDTPPDGPRVEYRTTAKANLRSEPSTAASVQALLEPDVIVWTDGKDGEWFEVWVHGWVHQKNLKLIG